jgi:hypothetical protein
LAYGSFAFMEMNTLFRWRGMQCKYFSWSSILRVIEDVIWIKMSIHKEK